MPDPKLSIQIETTATGQGVQQTADGLDKLAGSAQKAAPAVGQLGGQTKQTAAELGRGVGGGNAASMMVQNLASSTKGGASGFLSLARGAFGAGVALKGVLASMGPVGAIAAGVGIALGLITAALRKSEESADAAQAKLDKLNQQKLDKACEQQKALEDATDLAIKKIDAEFNALERIADAELNRRKSGVDAAVAEGKLSKEEGERRKLALDRQREDEKRVALLGAEEAKARTLEDLASQTTEQAKAENAEYERKKKLLEDVEAAKKAVAEATPSFESSIPGYEQAYGPAGKLADAEKAAAGLSQQQVEDQKKRADEQKAAAERAQKTAAEARAAADLERKVQGIENPLRQQTRTNEDKANRPETEAEKAKRETDQAKARSRAESTVDNFGLEVWKNRAANGMVDDVTLDVLKKRYPKVQFRTPSTPTAPLTPPSVDAAQQPPTASTPGTMVGPDGRVHTAAATTAGGGTMVGPDGRVIQVPAGGTGTAGGGTGIGPDGRQWTFPAGNGASTLTMGGQTFTGGAAGLKPAGQGTSDNKTAEALKGTTEATKEADVGQDTAKAAEELKKTTEEHAKAVKDSAAKTDAAMVTAGKALASASGVLTQHNSKLGQHDAEFRRVWGAISALQSSRAA